MIKRHPAWQHPSVLHALRSTPAHWRPLAALGLGVALLHLWLLAHWSGQAAPAPAGLARPVVQLLPQGLPQPLPQPLLQPASADAQPAAAPGAGHRLTDATPLPGSPALNRRPAADPRAAAPRASDGPVQPVQSVQSVQLGTQVPATRAAQAADIDDAATDPDSDSAAAAPAAATPGAEPPPLYPAQWPAAATLRYAMHYYGRSAGAVLAWRPQGASYSLQLRGLAPAELGGREVPMPPGRGDRQRLARPLIEQTSDGQLDANGLAPDRFTDRRRGRSQRAANFRRGLGRIDFSGPSAVQPAWPGAQDRLSWWVQLPAIVAAAAGVPPEVRLFVVDARGHGEVWRFQHLGPVAWPPGADQASVQHWRHEPAGPEGQRVELWLDPAQNHWPVQVRLTSLRSGARLELQLLAIDRPPP